MGAAAGIMGAQMIGGMLQNRRAGKASKTAKEIARRQSQYYQMLASPENFNALINNYRGQMQGAYAPQLRQMGDLLGMNEANAQQAFNADVARRGLSGSGMAFAGQNSIRAARMAGLGEAQRAYTMDTENAARQYASQTIGNQLQGASQFNPNIYVPPTPSTLEAMLNSAPGAIGMAGQYGQLTGGSGNLGSLLGLKGGPTGTYGPYQPYYIGNQPGRG